MIVGTDPRPFTAAPWMADALCRGTVGNLFFPIRGETPEPAKAICNQCPVKPECLTWALDNHETGIWGGTTERERMRILRKPRRSEPNCGTDGGYQSHLRYGEEICSRCQVAHEAAEWVRRRRGAA